MDYLFIKHRIYATCVKRIFDFFMAVILLVVLSPILAIIGTIIAIISGFPIIYKQERMGQGYKPFIIYKFRTMVNNADKIGPTSTTKGDTRVTGIGKVLRATSLDELPQILNILKGDMSFIGYRPNVKQDYQNPLDRKFLLKPGITGYAQVHGRSNLTKEEKEYWESKYPDDISFLTDLKVIILTIGVVLRKNNAY